MINAETSDVANCRLVDIPTDFINQNMNVNVNSEFNIKRIYYLYDVPYGSERGGHAHKDLYQLIIAASGAFNILLFDGKNKREITLNKPNIGLLVVPGIWRELNSFSSGSVCLVLASELYSESDYIREIEDFKKFKKS